MVNLEVLRPRTDCAANRQVAIRVQKQAASGALSENGGSSTIGENDNGVGATVVSHYQRIAVPMLSPLPALVPPAQPSAGKPIT
jgi:hypothetical protein